MYSYAQMHRYFVCCGGDCAGGAIAGVLWLLLCIVAHARHRVCAKHRLLGAEGSRESLLNRGWKRKKERKSTC